MEDSIAGSRSKRQKTDRHGRLGALEKLKKLKGSKNKYDVDSLENVYDTVDENEYTERVLQRQDDDWIEDDDGSGYVEDGREIFDDDVIEDSYVSSKDGDGRGGRGQKRKARLADVGTGKANIRNFIGNMPTKKREEVKTSDDNILSDIISDLDSNPSNKVSVKPKAVARTSYSEDSKRDAQNYFKQLSTSVKKSSVLQSFNGTAYDSGENKVSISVDDAQAGLVVKTKEPSAITEPLTVKEHEKQETKKNEWKIVKEIKQELEDGATQNIEEFHTQDIDFRDDFGHDDIKLENRVDVKNEEPSSIDIPQDFLKDNFELNTEKECPELVTSMWAEQVVTNDEPEAAAVQVDGSGLPLQKNGAGERVLRLYWLDAWEERLVRPGVVYVFGKVFADPDNRQAGCVSCCLVVNNIDRKIFLLPREYKLDPVTLEATDEEVTMMDVYQEFNTKVAPAINLKEFKSREVTKNYAFDLPDIPAQSQYLEVKYSAALPPPPTDKTYTTFSHIFGANTSSLETFLLERKIKGPCWLEVKAPENAGARVSWCKTEAVCRRMEDVSVVRNEQHLDPPPIVIAALNMRTIMDPKTKKTKIVQICCLVHHKFPIHKPAPTPPFQQHFCVMTKCNEPWPPDLKHAMSQYTETKLTKCDSERELLNYFTVQLWKLDPDLLAGHDLHGLQRDLLAGNSLDLGVPNWSRLGRLRRSAPPPVRKHAARAAFAGRLLADLKLSAMELIRARSYDLDALCAAVLPSARRQPVTSDALPRHYRDADSLLRLVSLGMNDAALVLRLLCELAVLPLALQMTQIAGNLLARTLLGGRSERNEFLLLHAFTDKGYVVPDKVYARGADTADAAAKTRGNKKAAYAGGLVLEPKKGFYDKLVLLMDFNSLYPSIIQEYNICFTTVRRGGAVDPDPAALAPVPVGAELGVLPTQIRRLVESRREVRKLMKAPELSPEQRTQYDIRQKALKLTANSMYGCLGFSFSRFYARPLAALVTLKGRDILQDTRDIVERLHYEVLYGDTDSLMINTNCLDYDAVLKIGADLKREINKKYRQIELDIDGVFRYLLLLKKKKYAAVVISRDAGGRLVTSQEHKGLDIVRRDWAQLAAEAGRFILDQILSDRAPDDRLETIHAHLGKLRDDLLADRIPLSALTVTKQLTKEPHEYADRTAQPHVQVALRLNAKNSRRFKKGDTVPYIICIDGTANPPTQRAYHVEELRTSAALKVDTQYYLAQQLHPVISRICEPVEGMEPARVAACLGLDPKGYKKAVRKEADSDGYQAESERDKYRQCEPFQFRCAACGHQHRVREMWADAGTFLCTCAGGCGATPAHHAPALANTLLRDLRALQARYAAGLVRCEDAACGWRSRRMPQQLSAGQPACAACHKGQLYRDYSERDLYLQINFYHYLFDVHRHNPTNPNKQRISPQVSATFQMLKELVEDWLAHSSYSIINLSKLFRFFSVDPKVTESLNTEPELYCLPETEDIDGMLELDTY